MKKVKLAYCFHVAAGKKDENQAESVSRNSPEKQRTRRTDRTYSTLVIPNKLHTIIENEVENVLDQGEQGSRCAIPHRMAVRQQGSSFETAMVIPVCAGREISEKEEGEALILLCKGCGSLSAPLISYTQERQIRIGKDTEKGYQSS